VGQEVARGTGTDSSAAAASASHDTSGNSLGQAHGPGGRKVSTRMPKLQWRHPAARVHHKTWGQSERFCHTVANRSSRSSTLPPAACRAARDRYQVAVRAGGSAVRWTDSRQVCAGGEKGLERAPFGGQVSDGHVTLGATIGPSLHPCDGPSQLTRSWTCRSPTYPVKAATLPPTHCANSCCLP